MSTERFLECTKDSVEEFTRYDRDVDIVTSWEYFGQAYKSYFQNYNFDRFPSYKTPQEQWMNPNFTIFFDRRYGIAFETYHRSGVANTPALLDNEIEKLESLDSDLKFKNRDGKLVEPKKFDIGILVDSGISQTLGHKIEEKIQNGDLDISANIVLMEFDFIEDNRSKYRFKRLSFPDQNFRDDILPDGGSISQKLSIKGGTFENIQVPIDDDYVELKATGMFTNRQTSNLYLACRLWDTVIKDRLTDNEWKIWKKGDWKKQIEKELSCSELSNEINRQYVPGANISEKDIKDALQYIAIAKRAVQVSEDEFLVKYSNLIEKRREHKDAPSERSDIEDLAYLLANWHCETKVDNSPKDIADIITSDSFSKADLSDISGNESISY